MLLLISFSFLAGLVTILAPCIWPLLPIVLSSAIAGEGKRRPLGIALGITVSFAVFTLALSSLVRIFHFDPNILRVFAVVVLIILGLSMILPSFSLILESAVSRLSGKFNLSGGGSGLSGGFLSGLALGVVWSPCAGPILAAITTLAATGNVTLSVVLITLAYSLGVGIPLFIFASAGSKILAQTRAVSSYTPLIQKIFGVFMILTAIAIYFNYDKTVELALLNKFPGLSQSLTSLETSQQLTQQLGQLSGKNFAQETSGLPNLGPAPDLVGGTNWLNTPKPLTLSDLKGKVVLVDFWTYTCINCIRTLPFVTSWYDKYKDQGFVVVGVHSPEFEFEHDTSNVKNAIKQFNIHYPVVQDNNLAIWDNFNNQYWPAEYLIDANGNLRSTHFGEGEYDQSEKNIQALLAEAGHQVNASLSNMTDQTPQKDISPESYLGSNRMEFYYPSGHLNAGTQSLSLLESIPQGSFSFGGTWNIMPEYAVASAGATLNYHFTADKVFLVLSPGVSSDQVKVFLDGKPVDSSNAGADVKDGVITIDSQRLYNLIDLKGNAGEHLLRLEFETNSTQAFAFTFG